MLFDVLGAAENIDETNVDLIYKHISARATQILQKKYDPKLRIANSMIEGARGSGAGALEDDGEDLDMEAAFDVQETEFAFGPRVKGTGKKGPKKRSNSFKLGSRPREMKDQVRKTYRRNSFHYKGAAIEVEAENKEENIPVDSAAKEIVKEQPPV